MSTIFISYAQADRLRAKPLAEFLKASGYTVWWDVGLRPGDNFTTEIQHQIQLAEHFIVIWSRTSAASFWVTAETTYARTCNKPILPLRIDDCAPPVPFNLLQTKDLESIERDGPEIVEALVRAGTLPSRFPAEAAASGAMPIAEDIVRKAQELARWEFIKGSSAVEDFRNFLARFPDGDLADLATMRLESLRWEEVTRERTVERLSTFLAEFPNGVKAPEARRCLERKRRALEQADWIRLRGGLFTWGTKRPDRLLADYERFLKLHPDGIHAAQAQSAVERLRRELDAWQAAQNADDRQAVERYLDEFPSGAYVSEARAHLARLNRQISGSSHGETPSAPGGPTFPLWTFISLAIAALLLGMLGAHLAVRGQFLVTLPFRSVTGETYHFVHPYPIFIGLFIAFLIHEWGNRSWLTTAFAFSAILLFRFVSQLLGLAEDEATGLPVSSMVIGALYCFGAWVAGFIVAPYMRRSVPVFFLSIVLGALCYPNWPVVLGLKFHGHEVVTAGIFFVACTMPIAYSLLRAPLQREARKDEELVPTRAESQA